MCVSKINQPKQFDNRYNEQSTSQTHIPLIRTSANKKFFVVTKHYSDSVRLSEQRWTIDEWL